MVANVFIVPLAFALRFVVVAAQRRSAGPTHRSLALDAIVLAAYERIADLRCAMRQVRKAAAAAELRHLVANWVIRVRSAAASAVRANHWSKARAIDRLAILDPTRVNSRRRRSRPPARGRRATTAAG